MAISETIQHGVSWQDDYQNRVNPQLMTRLLRTAIPVLDVVDWSVTTVREGFCESILPLTRASTNQHGTHQAALLSLSADYTGGLALATLLRGIPLAGIHRCTADESASLWLASMEVKYRSPSTFHVTATCQVPESVARLVQQRYFNGKRVLVTLPVVFRSNDEVVAEAEMKYFAQPTKQLEPTRENPKINTLFRHKLKASARMIAGVRADMQDSIVRVDRAHEKCAAGPHGELLAHRLSGILPQLKDMVTARTAHADQWLSSFSGLRQVVILGVGLDMRPMRLAKSLGNPMFFELDLPAMLEERTRVLSKISPRPVVARRMIAVDFKTESVADALLQHPDFDPRIPTAVIYEGCSMYFSELENRQILAPLNQALLHPDSQMWSDWVTEGVVAGTTQQPDICAFLDGMDELGERFIYGNDHPDAFLRPSFPRTDVTTCGDFLQREDPVLQQYQFATSHVRPAFA